MLWRCFPRNRLKWHPWPTSCWLTWLTDWPVQVIRGSLWDYVLSKARPILIRIATVNLSPRSRDREGHGRFLLCELSLTSQGHVFNCEFISRVLYFHFRHTDRSHTNWLTCLLTTHTKGPWTSHLSTSCTRLRPGGPPRRGSRSPADMPRLT